MNLHNYTEKNIYDICNVERAESGKIYKAGTCFIKLSAADDSVGQIKEAGEIESRYAALEPHEGINVAYLFIVIQEAFPSFFRRYRTTINLQFDTLKHFTVPWHEEKEAQDYIVSKVEAVDREIKLVQRQIEAERGLKKFYLDGMLVNNI